MGETTELGRELRRIRLGFLSSLDKISIFPSPAGFLDWQLELLNELIRTETELKGRKNEDWSTHKNRLRILGDTAAWKVLDPYIIRLLGRGDYIPPGLASQAQSLGHVINTAKEMTERGLAVVLCDLTRVLRCGDLIAATEKNEIIVCECKDRNAPKDLGITGRSARQAKKMESVSDFINFGLEATPLEEDGSLWLPFPNGSSASYTWDIIEEAVDEALEYGCSSKGIEKGNLVFSLSEDYEGPIPEPPKDFSPNRGASLQVAGHYRLIEDVFTYEPPPTHWDLKLNTRFSLLECDVFLNHAYDTNYFLGLVSNDPKVEVTAVQESDFRVTRDSFSFSFGRRYLNDVAFGYQTLESTKKCLYDALGEFCSHDGPSMKFPPAKMSLAFVYRDLIFYKPR